MFPFIHVGSLNIGTYGLCILIGAVAGVGVALIRAKRRNFPVEDTLFLSFFALIGVGVGAKILYLITILPDSPVAPNGIPLFPVQLVEAGLNFLLFFFLLWFAGKPRPQGRILGAYVIAYAVIRFVLEFLRYDYERGILWVFSTSQWISLILLPIGIWLLARRAKAGKKPVSVEPAGAGEAVEKE